MFVQRSAVKVLVGKWKRREIKLEEKMGSKGAS